MKTEREMLQAMERISSGSRINNAGDDAAGAAISDRMLATVRALDMSIRNASDVLSMAQVMSTLKHYKELENYQFKLQQTY